MNERERRADEALRGVLRALGDDVRRDFTGDARQHGPYRVLRMVGSGATSEVYAACREGDPDGSVRFAVKVIRPGADVREVLARFERERELIARVGHPAIVPVIESGFTPDGRPWFAMPLVEGSPITIAAEDAGLSPEARLALFARVLDAVAAAHAAGVIHRDLKPANILVERASDSLQPRLIDFGVARAVSGGLTRLTPNDHVHRLGTPDYMPPEQWRDGVAACDARSDVFALGIVLGELAAGALPRERREARRGGGRREPGATLLPSAIVASREGRAHAGWLRERIDPLFLRATATDPAARFADAGGFRAAIVAP